MSHREDLIERINKQIAQDSPGSSIAKHPVATLEEFFIGNKDLGSIGCNLNSHPGPEVFYRVLKEIRSKSIVSQVLVGISEVDPGSESWPFADEVYVTTGASADEIRQWFEKLQPDEIFSFEPTRANLPTPTPPHCTWVVWWD